MTPDKTPTDAELDAVLTEVVGSDDMHEHWLREIGRPVARAVLARWGAPVVAGEPVAWRLKDEDASLHYGKDIYVYYGKADFREGVNPCDFIDGLERLCLASQPTQSQAVPLTVDEVEQLIAQWSYEIHGDRARYLVRMTEQHHGIKGGQ